MKHITNQKDTTLKVLLDTCLVLLRSDTTAKPVRPFTQSCLQEAAVKLDPSCHLPNLITATRNFPSPIRRTICRSPKTVSLVLPCTVHHPLLHPTRANSNRWCQTITHLPKRRMATLSQSFRKTLVLDTLSIRKTLDMLVIACRLLRMISMMKTCR